MPQGRSSLLEVIAMSVDGVVEVLPLRGQHDRVVVGVDGSPRSLEAARYAAEVAAWRGWTLQLVSTWQASAPALAYPFDLDTLTTAGLEAAEEHAAKAAVEAEAAAPGVTVVRTVEEGPPAQLLTRISEGADLLVLGSRGLGGFSSLALGSVGQACVHHAPCPVLILRPKTRDDVE